VEPTDKHKETYETETEAKARSAEKKEAHRSGRPSAPRAALGRPAGRAGRRGGRPRGQSRPDQRPLLHRERDARTHRRSSAVRRSTAPTRVGRLVERALEAIAMDALLVSTVFGLGLLFLFDCLVRPHARNGAIGWLRRLGPRSAAAAAGAVVAYIATGWPMAALAGGLIAAAAPEILRRTRQERTRLERREAIAEVSSRLRDAIRSGIGLADAFTNVAEHAPASIRADLRRLISDARFPVSPKLPTPSRIACPIRRRICSPLRSGPRSGSQPERALGVPRRARVRRSPARSPGGHSPRRRPAFGDESLELAGNQASV
jgi:Flp pilus assembly protein TadB